MARLTDAERAERQKQKVAQERAKLAALEARISTRERKLDTQRKIVIGGTVLAAMHDDPALAAQITALVRARVTRAQDKAVLLDFFPAPANSNKQSAA